MTETIYTDYITFPHSFQNFNPSQIIPALPDLAAEMTEQFQSAQSRRCELPSCAMPIADCQPIPVFRHGEKVRIVLERMEEGHLRLGKVVSDSSVCALLSHFHACHKKDRYVGPSIVS